jgi:hypothetical protein
MANSTHSKRGRKSLNINQKKVNIMVSLPPDLYRHVHHISHSLKIPVSSLMVVFSEGIIESLYSMVLDSRLNVPDSRSGRDALLSHLIALLFKAHEKVSEVEEALFPDSQLMRSGVSDE